MLKNKKLFFVLIPLLVITLIAIVIVISLPKAESDPNEFKDGEPREFPVTLDD